MNQAPFNWKHSPDRACGISREKARMSPDKYIHTPNDDSQELMIRFLAMQRENVTM
jgi:hypothetical protein